MLKWVRNLCLRAAYHKGQRAHVAASNGGLYEGSNQYWRYRDSYGMMNPYPERNPKREAFAQGYFGLPFNPPAKEGP